MLNILNKFLLAFIPLFAAVDAIGNIPLFVSLVEGTQKKQRQKIIVESITTATIVAVLFMFGGKWVLSFIGITMPDFQIAGGALLFIISMRLLLPGSTKFLSTDSRQKDVGVFPLGTPLITGPAVLTTTLMLLDVFGPLYTFAALVVNMLVVWVTLAKADVIMKIMGNGGTRAFAKIMYILLAAIGVMMIRKGISGVFRL